MLQELSVCGAIPGNKASGMGGAAGLHLMYLAHPAKEHQDEGDRLGQNHSYRIMIRMHKNTAGYEKCTIPIMEF